MMTAMTPPTLFASQQSLIDARLDTIERMLTGRVPRSDRISIVREVESQIHELLSDRELSAVSREDVLDVLRRLDPPEAYLPEETDDDTGGFAHRPMAVAAPQKSRATTSGKHDGLIGGVSGIVSFAMFSVVLFSLIVLESFSNLLFFTPTAMVGFLGFVSNIMALVFSIRGRHQGAWPIVGLIFGVLMLTTWTLGALFLVLQLL